MSRKRSSLSGAWSGAYRYPDDARPETVFNAQLEERDGAFTGSTQEPDLLQPGGVVTADLDGTRIGLEVRFVKFADGSGGMHHAIIYEGRADEALTYIEGRWTIPGDWSGTFFMSRDDDGAEEAVEREAAAPIPRFR